MRYRCLSKYKYSLTADEVFLTNVLPPKRIDIKFIRLDTNGILVVREGYAYDGASKPAIDSITNRRAAAAHDAFYQLMRLGLLPLDYRLECDEEYYKICLRDGMWSWRAKLEKWAINNFAEFAARPQPNEQEIIVLVCP